MMYMLLELYCQLSWYGLDTVKGCSAHAPGDVAKHQSKLRATAAAVGGDFKLLHTCYGCPIDTVQCLPALHIPQHVSELHVCIHICVNNVTLEGPAATQHVATFAATDTLPQSSRPDHAACA